MAHGDTLVRNHDGSFGSKLLRFDGILEVGRGEKREGREGRGREREVGRKAGGMKAGWRKGGRKGGRKEEEGRGKERKVEKECE